MSDCTDVPAASTFASTSNPVHAIMPLTEATTWLHEYFLRESPFIVGDDLATCFHSCGAVILMALILGDNSPAILASVSSYPTAFVDAVLSEMRDKHLWSMAETAALTKTLRESPSDWECLRDDLNDVTDQFWGAVWTHEMQIALETLRRGVLFGGKTQSWIDNEFLDFFQPKI